MSLVGLGGLHGNKGLAKGKPSPVTDVTINAVAGSLLYASTAPTLTGAASDVNITGVAGALLYASSAPMVEVGGMAITDPGAYIWLTSDSSKSVTTTLSVADTTDGGSGTYDLSVVVTEGGTFTLSGTTGLTFSVGDGTADASMTFNGTIASINTALTNATFQGLVDEDATATVTFTRDSDSESTSSVIGLLALPALTTTNIIETLAIGSTIQDFTTALTGSSATVAVSSVTYYSRPVLSGFTLTNNANGTADIDFTTDEADGDLYWVAVSDTTVLSGQTTYANSGAYVAAGQNLLGAAADGDSGTVVGGTAGAKTITTGALANATWYIHVVHLSDTTDDDANRIASEVYSGTVTTTGASGGAQASGWLWMGQVF